MSSDIKRYVAGFIFFDCDHDLSFEGVQLPGETIPHVLLILKDRPDWQAGNYNGIGGKVETGEWPLAAMRRECFEECGLRIDNWKHFARLIHKDFEIEFFAAFLDHVPKWEDKTSEKIFAFPVSSLPKNLVGCVGALVPLARTEEVNFTNLYATL